MSDHLKTVASIYEAFGRGDVPAILATLSDQVQWEAWADNHAQRAGVPWLRRQHGRAGAEQFFETIAGFTIHDFQVLSLMGAESQVAAEILIEATVPAGARYRDEEMHLWTFDASGQVIRFRHYVDTAKHIAAARSTS
jgi:ketosteroid isomerase-like protein